MPEYLFADSGHAYGLVRALEDRYAEPLLEFLDLRGECGLTYVAGLGGPTKVTLVSDGRQIFQVPQVHFGVCSIDSF